MANTKGTISLGRQQMDKAALSPDEVLSLHVLPHGGVGGEDGDGGEEEAGQMELWPEGGWGLQGWGQQVAHCTLDSSVLGLEHVLQIFPQGIYNSD